MGGIKKNKVLIIFEVINNKESNSGRQYLKSEFWGGGCYNINDGYAMSPFSSDKEIYFNNSEIIEDGSEGGDNNIVIKINLKALVQGATLQVK